MNNPIDIVVPDLSGHELGFTEMWLDGIKATKMAADPVSDAFGCCLGTLCCVAVTLANAEENDRPATRHDVVHAERIRKNQAAEANAGYTVGRCIGDAAIDTVSISVGSIVGLVRASIFSSTGNNNSQNTVFGYSRKDIDEVNLFDSCSCG